MKTSTDADAETGLRYRAFAEVEARGLSACYETWAAGVAGDPGAIALIDSLPAPKRQPNLVFSAARFLGAEAGSYPVFRAWLEQNGPAVELVCRSHATQTNEPGRCAVLLPVLGALPGPLALIEVGASAGLCLVPHRYSYRYTGDDSGAPRMLHPPGGPSPVLLDCRATGVLPVPEVMPTVL